MKMFIVNIEDLDKREFTLLCTLIIPTIILGVYTAPILDGLNYAVSTLIYNSDIFDKVILSPILASLAKQR